MRYKRLGFLSLAAFFGLCLLAATGLAEEDPDVVINLEPADPQLQVNLRTDKTRYKPKESLKIHYELSHSAYLYIYNVDANGEVNLLFPNRYDQENYLQPGEGSLPRRGYSFLVGEKEGREFFQAIASTRQLPMFPSPGAEAFSEAAFPKLSQKAEDFTQVAGKEIIETGREGEWSLDWTSIEITSRTANLFVTSRPSGARIYVDDQFRGETPASISVQPGTCKLDLKLGDNLRWSGETTVAREETKTIQADLQQVRFSWLRINSEPPGAEIYLDGTFRGETPREVRLEAKEHEVRLEKDGYRIWRKSIDLSPSVTESLFATLRPATRSAGPPEITIPIGFGVNAGISRENRLSFGGEISLGGFYLGGSFRDNSTADVPENIHWTEKDWQQDGVTLNYGPEWKISLGYLFPISSKLYLRAGGGVSVQARAELEPLNGGLDQSSLQVMTDVYRNAHRTHLVVPGLEGGLQIRINGFLFDLSYHSRRGPFFGFGIRL